MTEIERYIDGTYRCADAEALWETLKPGSDVAQLEEAMEQVWDDYAGTTTNDQYLQYKNEARSLLERSRHRKGRLFSLRSWMKYAAIVLLVLTTGITGYHLLSSSGSDQAETPLMTLHVVDYGKKEYVTLSDGTKVILNAGSQLTYPQRFEDTRRVVRLDGEAFFEVAKNQAKPFIIQTSNAAIEVLGTAFNVKAYDEDEFIAVMVETGKVQVNTEEAMMQLSPGEQFLLDKTNHEIHKNRENIAETKSWIYGGLYFNKTPIHSVINELTRRYNCSIEFEKGLVTDDYISGAHDNRTLEAVLKSIYYATGINYRKDKNKITLYK
jgi:ferric-dicitrate binding protein FerR (iron transport regulator)